MLELVDSIRDELGSDISGQYSSTVKPALEELYTTLETARTTLAQAVAILTGEEGPAGPAGAPEMGMPGAKKEDQRLFFFMKPPRNAVVGEGKTVHMPINTQAFDWEVELALVIGKTARNVSLEQALSHVAAYTVAIDFSARDHNRAPETFYKLDLLGTLKLLGLREVLSMMLWLKSSLFICSKKARWFVMLNFSMM
jgi:hypothetical protein